MNRSLDAPQVIRRSILAVLLALVALGLLAARPASPAAGADAARARLARLALYATRDAHGTPRTTFSASQDNELYVYMVWAGVRGTHDAYLTFRSPDGAIYQILDVPFVARDGAVASADLTRQQPGVLHPIRVQGVTLDRDRAAVWGVLPIAGTWMSRLLGAWSLQVRLDADPTVVGTAAWTLTQ